MCADKFRALPDGEAKAVALSKVDSWKRRDEFPKEIVIFPGGSYPSRPCGRVFHAVACTEVELRSNDITSSENSCVVLPVFSASGPASVRRPEIPASEMRFAD